ncbi:fatty acid desaturase [Pyxidicoccus parkwayensis]|uniref:Fatty acid desaturase n=1 Tax=Pyxidicoccus parkwayensis TaxID=2813578 RepID=A0ABX7NMM3_9BACT|nr:fatty acid desaturase [Pyxidicoccus parkwaysis]QSQ20096.1 fatty acid desaturase [Pyxidicoccus parkwaysis]
MTLFRNPRDRIPVLLFLIVFALDLTVYFTARSWWLPILWLALWVIPKGWICAWNHHHQHVPTFRHALPNRLLDVVFGFQTGVTSHAWFLHHVLGHHRNYLDQEKDEARWKRRDGTPMGEVEFSVINTLVAYPRAFRVGLAHPRVLPVFLGMGALQVALLGLLFWHDAYNALWVFLLPMAVSLYVTVWATYFHHVGLDATEHTAASYNIVHRGYNLMTGNLGYHTAHHARHGVHWSQLPELHAQLAHDIPASLYRQPGIPFVWSNPEAQLELAPEGVEALALRSPTART